MIRNKIIKKKKHCKDLNQCAKILSPPCFSLPNSSLFQTKRVKFDISLKQAHPYFETKSYKWKGLNYLKENALICILNRLHVTNSMSKTNYCMQVRKPP
jgi:hypothetical protein